MGNEIYIFLSCVLCGVMGGIGYSFFYCIGIVFRGRIAHFVLEVCFFLLFAGIYLFVSVLFGLPSLRLYMFAGCLIGLVLYEKSLHKSVAFLAEKVYNGCKERMQKMRCGKTWRAKKLFRKKK